ncbi:MAG: sugar transferase [Bdellovibrionales bacterium]|nr:sugar transferase [Bdellovibrionales bacterium]
MNRLGAQHQIYLSVAFLLSACTFEIMVHVYDRPLLLALALTFFVTLGSGLAMEFLGFFHTIRPYPRKSDLILVMFAIPPLTVIGERVLGALLLDEIPVPLPKLLVASCVLSIGIFVLHYCVCRFIGVNERRKNVVLCLPALEAISFIRRLSQLGLTNYLTFVSYEQFARVTARGSFQRPVHLVVWSDRSNSGDEETECLVRTHLAGVPIVHVQSMIDSLTGRIDLSLFDLWRYLSRAKPQTGSIRIAWRLKNFSEPLFALLLLFCFAPLMVAVALAIKFSSRGPIIFRQERVGKAGALFTLYKFRTMVSDAESNGPQWAKEKDNRITPLGNILRKTRMDELPQLVNVIRGEMSFCGPRPERPEMYEELEKHIKHYWLRTLVKPGITGWAQIQAGYAASIAESRKKLEYDLYYIQNMSPRLDLIIFIYTVLYALGAHKPREHQEVEYPKEQVVPPVRMAA